MMVLKLQIDLLFAESELSCLSLNLLSNQINNCFKARSMNKQIPSRIVFTQGGWKKRGKLFETGHFQAGSNIDGKRLSYLNSRNHSHHQSSTNFNQTIHSRSSNNFFLKYMKEKSSLAKQKQKRTKKRHFHSFFNAKSREATMKKLPSLKQKKIKQV